MFESLKYNLKHNRRSVMKNATAWLIFGAIILVFVFWGLTPSSQSISQGGAVATVNDTAISQAQFFETMERMERDPRFQQFQGLGADVGRQLLQSQAIGQLIEMELIRQATDKEHIWTSDAEVRDVITGISAFHEEGRFKREYYMNYLASVRKMPAEFEEEIRRDQSLSRAVRIFSAGLSPLGIEKEKMKSLRKIRANLEFVSIPTETLVIPETIPQADIKSFLVQPEAEAKVAGYYESHRQEFATPEQVKVRHILIRINPEDPESEKKALAKIEDLAKKADARNFAQLAKQHSEDPGSKTNGGLIDFFARGRMVPEFENAAFSMAKANEISRPVKTDYGYHLIQFLEKRAAKSPTLDDLREEIASILLSKERSQSELSALQEALKNGDRSGIQNFVRRHKLKWEETGAFSIDADSVPKIGANDEVVRLAFQLTSEQPLPSALVREGARALLVQYKAAPQEKKADDSVELADMMLERRGEEALRGWVDQLRSSARISTNPAFASGGLPIN